MMTTQEKGENFPNGFRLNPDPHVPDLINITEDEESYIFDQHLVYQGKDRYKIDELWNMENAQNIYDSLISLLKSIGFENYMRYEIELKIPPKK